MLHRAALAAIALASVASATPAAARHDHLRFPISDAVGTTDAKQKLDPEIRLYFGPQKHPKALQSFGTDKTSKKTNFFNKDDKTGCEWVFLSALIQLQKRARELGANAVVGIASLTPSGEELASESEYECSAGNVIGGVALRGEFVRLP